MNLVGLLLILNSPKLWKMLSLKMKLTDILTVSQNPDSCQPQPAISTTAVPDHMIQLAVLDTFSNPYTTELNYLNNDLHNVSASLPNTKLKSAS